MFNYHHDQLKIDMETRFEDLTKLQIPEWILNSLSFQAINNLDNSLETEFLHLSMTARRKLFLSRAVMS